MNVTAEQITAMGVPVDVNDTLNILRVNAALEYITANTTLEFDETDITTLQALPSAAKLFICRYVTLYGRDPGVTSESVGGLSQGFDSNATLQLVQQLAAELLGPYLKSGAKFTPAVRKWC